MYGIVNDVISTVKKNSGEKRRINEKTNVVGSFALSKE